MQQVNLCNFNAEACQTALHFFLSAVTVWNLGFTEIHKL